MTSPAYRLNHFGRTVALMEYRGYPTWERWAVAHLSKSCDEPTPCDLHREWQRYAGASHIKADPRPRKITPEVIQARINRNAELLDKALTERDEFLRANASHNDPAVVNAPLRTRPGRLTDAKVAQWSRIGARVADLESRLVRDRARLAKLGSDA